MRRSVSVNWPTPAVQRLNKLSLNATTGSCGTRMKLITPIRKKLPFASWRISSHRSEHWRSGKMRVGCMGSGFLGSACGLDLGGGGFRCPHGVLHQHGDSHWPDASGVWRDEARYRLNSDEIHIANQAGAALGRRIGHAVDAHVHY